jgi:benzoyl-CoA reductase/2-hydroxyglutaryl-CoA dehydratase subunit BcrC/BadD/HgdB
MGTVDYCNPFIPVEWLAAHGLQPRWLRLPRSCPAREIGSDLGERPPLPGFDSPVNGRRGVCPLAAAVADAVSSAAAESAVVLTTCCDQMRYAASLLENQHRVPVFVMNVPSTWQTAASRSLYLAELQRLSRFLVARGGTLPSNEDLAGVMLRFDRARAELREVRCRLSAREFAAALLAVREDANPGVLRERAQTYRIQFCRRGVSHMAGGLPGKIEFCTSEPGLSVPLALAGGPLPESDYDLFDWVHQAGGRVVLDATEWGERTLPRALDVGRTHRDPLPELADAYFGTIPEVFRRPNGALYEYLGRELAARHACGLIVRRYLWCDLWHAEVAQLKSWSPVPVLDLDAADSEASSEGRTRGRIEAFLEMLR